MYSRKACYAPYQADESGPSAFARVQPVLSYTEKQYQGDTIRKPPGDHRCFEDVTLFMEQLQPRGSSLIHHSDIQYVINCVDSAKCCAIVGLSNMGKSCLLRTLVSPEATAQLRDEVADRFLFVYIDFNLMLDVSEQGFYELILRSVLAELECRPVPGDLMQHVHQA